MRVLLAEDQTGRRARLSLELRRRGCVLTHAVTFAEAASRLQTESIDVLIADETLAEGNGLDLIASYRARGGTAGAILMADRNGREKQVEALDRGADDVIVDPIDFDELYSRIRLLARRPRQWTAEVYRFAGLMVDCEQQAAFIETRPLELTPKEFLLIRAMAQRPEQLIRREDLVNQVWGDRADRGNRSLNVHIRNIRLKLRGESAGVVIGSRRGRGYGLFCPQPRQ